MEEKKVVLIEDHHQALEAWRREKFKGLPLIHLDAHIDFGFYQAKPFHQIMKEAKCIKEIQQQLEKSLLYTRYKEDLEEQLNIGNYIYPAMREQIVNRFYWVVPGGKNEFKRGLKNIKRLMKRLRAEDPKGASNINESRQKLSTQLYKNYFEVASVLSLKKIKDPVLLDIDVDFLLFDSISRASLTENLGRRRPWIYPKELVRYIKKRLPKVAYTTISYSVNGGFSPLEYKFFGDELALRLKGNLDKKLEQIISLRDGGIEKYLAGKLRVSLEDFEEAAKRLKDYNRLDSHTKSSFFAHLYFWLYTICWRLEKKDVARTYYRRLLKEDPTYRRKDNNSGWLYLRKKDLNSAKREFEKILYCDDQDYFSLSGLGEVFYQRKRYRKALDKYKQALRINPDARDTLFGITGCQIALDRLNEAKRSLIILKKKEPANGSTFFLEGRLNKRLSNYNRSLLAYKEAVMLGRARIELYKDVFNMLRVRKDAGLFEFFKQKYGSFKSNFYKNQKKILLKEKREDEFRSQAKRIKRIDRILKTLLNTTL